MTEYVRRALAGEMTYGTPTVVAVVPRMQTKTLERPKVTNDSARKMDNGRPYNLIIWNDDHNTVQHVTRCLIEVVGLPPANAVKVMAEAHNTGKAVAKTCVFEMAEHYRDQLESKGLTATIEET